MTKEDRIEELLYKLTKEGGLPEDESKELEWLMYCQGEIIE